MAGGGIAVTASGGWRGVLTAFIRRQRLPCWRILTVAPRLHQGMLGWIVLLIKGDAMGNLKTFGLVAFERWGGLRPACTWDSRGRCFVPLFGGIWVRRFYGIGNRPDTENFTPYIGMD